jgi:MFS family permease
LARSARAQSKPTVTSLLAGRVGDIFGRRATIFAGACIFTLGGLFQAFATGFRVMVFGRIISGFGVGFLSMCVPVYQSEISPAENRGKLACIEFTVSTPLPCMIQEKGVFIH